MSIPTVHVSGPAEVLAAIETRLGFRPVDSLAVASIRHAHTQHTTGLGILGLVARVDLSPLDTPEAAQVARTLARHLHNDGATLVIAAAYTPDPNLAQQAVDLLDDHLEVPLAPLHVTATTYRPLGVPDEDRPLTDLDATVVAATRVAQGLALAATEDDLTRLPEHNTTSLDLARTAWTQAATAPDSLTTLRHGLDHWITTCHRGTPLDEPTLGLLGATLDQPLGRDAILISLIPGIPADLPQRGLTPTPDTDTAHAYALASVVAAEYAVLPDDDLTERATTVLTHVVAVAAPGHRAPALTLCGWIAWWTGDGVRARRWIDKALTDIPDYRLATLVAAALDHGLPPGHVVASRR